MAHLKLPNLNLMELRERETQVSGGELNGLVVEISGLFWLLLEITIQVTVRVSSDRFITLILRRARRTSGAQWNQHFVVVVVGR